VYGLQQLVLHLDCLSTFYKSLCCALICLQELLCCTWTCLSTKACISLGCLQLQEPELHYCVSVYKSFRYCSASGRVCLQEPVLCLEELFAAPVQECLQESVLLWTCLSTRACACLSAYKCPTPQYLYEYVARRCKAYTFSLFVWVCFDIGMFVSIVSIRVRNTKKTENLIFWFYETNRKTTETD
jgi:hypothetical protein